MAERSNSGGSRSKKGLSGPEAIERVRQELPPLLGRPIESVLGLERDDDGWRLAVQVVELSRIPSSTDVLGAYEVSLDRDGELAGYRRVRRYHRNQADED
jgi:gas vesicle protein GvpO